MFNPLKYLFPCCYYDDDYEPIKIKKQNYNPEGNRFITNNEL
jgi:hypothetical protein